MDDDKKSSSTAAESKKDSGESIESLAKRAFANVKKNGGKVPDEVKIMAKNALKQMEGGSDAPKSAALKQKPIASSQTDCGGEGCSIEELTDRVLQMPGTGRSVDNDNDSSPSAVPELAKKALDHMDSKSKIMCDDD